MYIPKTTFFLFIVFLALGSCKKEPVPAYIYVPDITLNTEMSEGSASEKITDVWVFQNGSQQGAYEMPVTLPIIAEGPTTLLFFGGIKLNGISATRAMYSFYAPDTVYLDLEPSRIDTVIPQVKYRKNIEIKFIEDFETPSNLLFYNLDLVTDPAIVFEGNASGRLRLDSTSSEAVATTKSVYTIRDLTAAAFLELNYKSNYVFTVAIKGYKNGQSVTVDKLNIAPQDNWNKIYVNFTPEINQIQADYYEILLKTNVQNAAVSPVHIYVDNIKLISFP